jgi:hypothetical protein
LAGSRAGAAQLSANQADLQEWRELFAERLRDQGVEAQALCVMKAKVEEVIHERDGARPLSPAPWDEAIERRQAQIRATYAVAERDLRAVADADSRKAADQLAVFLEGLPLIETQKAQLKRLSPTGILEPLMVGVMEPPKGR